MTHRAELPDLIKIAGLPIDEQGRLLVVKWKNKPIWFSLGGVLEKDETEEECLRREIREELDVEAIGEVKHFCDTPIEIAAGRENTTIIIKFYLVRLPGNLQVDDDEIEAYKWISRTDYEELLNDHTLEIGSGLKKYTIPALISAGLMK
jgi:8-oxo-dGTP diphosphatase